MRYEGYRIYFQNGGQKQNEGNKVIKRQAKRTLACSLVQGVSEKSTQFTKLSDARKIFENFQR
jgi:hypothetical protein